jgi:hypothetical protein
MHAGMCSTTHLHSQPRDQILARAVPKVSFPKSTRGFSNAFIIVLSFYYNFFLLDMKNNCGRLKTTLVSSLTVNTCYYYLRL